ncbi:MAG: hypothetical protein QW134_06715 [Nitrososphaeria archaeon]
MFCLVSPLYVFFGDVVGHIGFVEYNVMVFDEPFYSASMDSIRTFASFLLLQSIFSIVCTIFLYFWADEGKTLKPYAGIVFGGLAASVACMGILYGCYHLLQMEVRSLAVNFSHETSAGKIVFSGSNVIRQPADIILSNHLLLPALASSIILFVYAYTKHSSERVEKSEASA